MKKILSAILAVTVCAALTAPAFAHNFSDIGEENYAWAVPYIEEMYDGGYISGYEDGTFRPDNEVTRLECLALFARAMGSRAEENKDILEMAHDDYDSMISNYSLLWGQDEIAYLLYKGVLKKSDLDTYLLGQEKDIPMKRYEAAIIITKALGGESEATAANGIVLDYTDAREIPSNAVQYVDYVKKAEIMEGMEDGSFSPNTSVLRSQMAVMLKRTVDKTQYKFVKAKLMSVSENDRNVVYKSSDGEETRLVYTQDTVMRVLGTLTQPRLMTAGVSAIFTLSNDELVSIDALSETPDETVVGIYKGYTSSNGTLRVMLTVNGESKTYECAPDVSIIYAGSPANIRTFNNGDSVELSMTNGKVATVSGSEKEIEVKSVTIEDMILDDIVKITISSANDEYDGQTYEVDSNVVVSKNNVDSDLSKIYVGDTANLTLQYGIIKKIVAKSTSKVVDGSISALTISSPNSYMTVKVKDVETEYMIPSDVTITVNDKEGTLYDFRVGDTVKITTESGAITKIVATTTQATSGELKGVVTGVNSSYGFVSIQEDNGQVTQVFCKDSKTKFITSTGVDKKMSYIQAGQTVTARGTIKNGAFECTLMIIEAE